MKTYEDLAKLGKPVKFATSGVGPASYTETQLLRSALNLKIEVVPGFNGKEGEIAYDPAHENNEPKKIACEG